MQQKNNLISAIVITYNEENNLDKSLESINWIDEIIVIDSYSDDQTVNIAKKYTGKIFYKKFEDNFSDQRNFALQKVSHKSKWILVLDADESLSNRSRPIIEKLIQLKQFDGYWLPRRNYISVNTYLRHGLFYPDYQLRLFRNESNIKYRGAIHEELTIDKYKTQEITSVEIYHNYSHTKYDKLASFLRFVPYMKIESKNLAKSTKSNARLFFEGIWDVFRFFFSSFIRGKGYKDGYSGLRAGLLFSFYRGLVSFIAIKYRMK